MKEEIKTHIGQLFSEAEKEFEMTGELAPFMVLYTNSGVRLKLPAIFVSQESKDNFYQLVGLLALTEGATVLASFAEAWISKYDKPKGVNANDLVGSLKNIPPPRQDPKRGEAITASAVERIGQNRMHAVNWMREIQRKEGKTTLEPLKVTEDEMQAFGNLVEILPPLNLPSEIREKVLQDLGPFLDLVRSHVKQI